MNLNESENPIRNAEQQSAGTHGNLPSTGPAAADASPVLMWSVHPSSRHPVKTALSVMIVAMIASALYRATGTFLYSLIAVIVFLVTLSPFFLRTDYRMDLTGITMRRPGTTRYLKWDRVRSVATRTSTVYVSPYSLNSIRSRSAILLMCPDNRDAVLDYIRGTGWNDRHQD